MGVQRAQSEEHVDDVTPIGFSPVGGLLEVGDYYGAKLWDTETNQQIVRLEGHSD